MLITIFDLTFGDFCLFRTFSDDLYRDITYIVNRT